MIATAPAKVILSGEHAVVYGAPALALAVRRFARCQLSPLTGDARFLLRLPDLHLQRELALAELGPLRRSVAERHAAYLQQQLSIDAVADPAELLLCALADWLAANPSVALSSGLTIEVDSQIPVGSGMGSSAAVCASLLAAVSAYVGLPLDRPTLQRFVTETERLQHGRSSGLDPALSVNGGMVHFCRGETRPVAVSSLPGRWQLVNTGTPVVSTGECVERVRQRFADSAVWQRFAQVTTELESALEAAQTGAIRDLLRTNHRLLCDIGVVPPAVQQFIAGIEAAGGAAKISGAGAVQGDAAGLIVVYHPESSALPALPAGYQLMEMELDSHGTRLRS